MLGEACVMVASDIIARLVEKKRLARSESDDKTGDGENSSESCAKTSSRITRWLGGGRWGWCAGARGTARCGPSHASTDNVTECDGLLLLLCRAIGGDAGVSHILEGLVGAHACNVGAVVGMTSSVTFSACRTMIWNVHGAADRAWNGRNRAVRRTRREVRKALGRNGSDKREGGGKSETHFVEE